MACEKEINLAAMLGACPDDTDIFILTNAAGNDFIRVEWGVLKACIQNLIPNILDIVNIGGSPPDPLQTNTVQVNTAGEVFFVDKDGDVQQLEFIQQPVNIADTTTVAMFGDGLLVPITAQLKVSPQPNNGVIIAPDGVFVESSAQTVLLWGGQVTWLSGYTYKVQPAGYKILGNYYTSPYTEITLDPSDPVLNRIDAFVVNTSGLVAKITGTPSANPELPAVNTSTELQISFALVVAASVAPNPVVPQEYVYRENAGTPTEWAVVTNAPARINLASAASPNIGAVSIEGTGVLANDTITATRLTPFKIYATNNTFIMEIKSKGAWNNNKRINFQFKNGVTNVGTSIAATPTSYGFDSSQTVLYMRFVIPLSVFGLTPNDTVDTILMTFTGTGAAIGFYIDDVQFQGSNLVNNYVGTNDNVGVFYVNRNFTGIAAAIVTGYTLATIASTNASYNAQLINARMGDMNKAYPCPYSARNAALDAIASGNINKAYIRVLGGSQYTIGSDVAANNGLPAGGAATATVADIGFSSANRTLVASLMKNNVFYYFEVNSMLKFINRTYAINSGCYNVDATDTTFVSGIYGKGLFHHVYGNGDGTISNFSQRFIEVNNTRCSIVFECDEAALQRASFFIFSHKRIDIRARNYYCDSESFFIALQGTTPLNEGDGLPTSITCDIENFYKGNVTYPYSLTTNNTSLSRPMFALDVINATRQKNLTFKIKNLFVNGCDLQDIYASFLGGINRPCVNNNMILEIDNLYQSTDVAKQAFAILFAPLITTSAMTTNQQRENFHETFIIKNANINAPLIRVNSGAAGTAGNKNNSCTIKLGTVVRRAVNAGSLSYIIGLPTVPSAAGVTNAVVGERLLVKIQADFVSAEIGKVFSESYTLGVPVYIGATTVVGTFVAKDGSPVAELTGTGNMGVFDSAILIAKGAATQTLQVNNGGNPVVVFTKDTLANLPYETGITHKGVLDVDSDIANFF